MLRFTKWMKHGAFVLLLTTALVLGPAREAMASSCFDISSGSGNTVWLWACGWFSSNPCSDGTVEDICNYWCQQHFSGSQLDWIVSCQSSEEVTGWWMSWAECVCYYP
jgi:hypothetical protein